MEVEKHILLDYRIIADVTERKVVHAGSYSPPLRLQGEFLLQSSLFRRGRQMGTSRVGETTLARPLATVRPQDPCVSSLWVEDGQSNDIRVEVVRSTDHFASINMS